VQTPAALPILEARGRLLRDRSSFGVDGPELDAIAVCLLEVVAEDLLVLARPQARLALQPIGVPFVQLGAEPLGGRLVGRVADEDV
jgi:hypothetical protein